MVASSLMAKLHLRPMRVSVTDTRRLRPHADRQAGDHLATQAHRRWAAVVLRASGGVCQWPGCNETRSLVADHRIERKDAPELALELSNGWALCRRHHTEKTIAERARRMRS
jgi:5-methylcytosine-specific restriction protein A